MSKVWIGTSGWTYDGWRGPFYPPDLAKKNWLGFYSGQFPTTEINGSFYRTPSLEAVKAWRDQTPATFLFAWEGVEVHHPLETPRARVRELHRADGDAARSAGSESLRRAVSAPAALFEGLRTVGRLPCDAAAAPIQLRVSAHELVWR
jgi:Protein of unknown function DUF72